MTPSYRTPLKAARNFRDFGGYAARDGRRVKWNRLYRSGALSSLGDGDKERFLALGIAVVCDLRRKSERKREPFPYPAGPGVPLEMSIPVSPGSSDSMYRGLYGGTLTTTQSQDLMIAINRQLASEHTEQYQLIFRQLFAVGDRPLLIQCSAGKDRTGFAAALVLLSLGVPRETVLEDYLLSNRMLADEWERFFLPELRTRIKAMGGALNLDDIRPILEVRTEYLEAAFDEIDARFGSLEDYFEDGLRLRPEELTLLRERLLE